MCFAVHKMPEQNLYEVLGISQTADVPEVIEAYRLALRQLKESAGQLPREALETKQILLKEAFDTISNPARRRAYDADLALRTALKANPALILNSTIVNDKPKRSPLRTPLTIIATMMVIGLVIQVGVMYSAYKRNSAALRAQGMYQDATVPANDRVILQEYYQTYGIRANSREEAEAMLADRRAREEAERERRELERRREEAERQEKRFAEESRRRGEQVSAELRWAEQQAAQQEAEAKRQAEYRKRAAEEEQRMREEEQRQKLERDMNRFRHRAGDPVL